MAIALVESPEFWTRDVACLRQLRVPVNGAFRGQLTADRFLLNRRRSRAVPFHVSYECQGHGLTDSAFILPRAVVSF